MGGHHAEFAHVIDFDVLILHGCQIHSHAQQVGDHLVKVHHFIGCLAQPLVHHGDGLHTALGLLQFLLDLVGLGFARLQPE